MASGPASPPPSKELALKHLARARQHYQTYVRLKNGGQDLDFAVVALFYTALHLVEAYFVEHHGYPTRDHQRRRDRVGALLTPLFQHYRTLEDKSQDARYEPDHLPFTAEEVQELEVLDFTPLVAGLKARGISLLP
jgi:hypothetical protein